MGQSTSSSSSSSMRKSPSRSNMLSKKSSSSKLLKAVVGGGGIGGGIGGSGGGLDSNILNLPQQRVIMLGTGGVGKSTLFKNVKLLFNGGFDNDEYLSYREVILSNIVQMVQFVLRALSSMFPDEKLMRIENEEFANSVLRLDCEDFIHILRIVDEHFITRMQKLWFEEPCIQKAYHFRHRYQLPVEDLPDLVKQMDQIYSMPKTKHVMSSYVKTTGIVETECVYRNNRIRVFDTGGQRNERKKWVHLFGSTSGIIFIVSLSEYNQVCYEDDRSNRMKESLLLFEEIVNASCFENVPIFLVFNKKDVFLHKIQYFDISEAFEDLPKHIRLHKPIKNFHKLAGDAKRRYTIQQKRQKRIPGTFESAQNSKTMERFQRARSASIQKRKNGLSVGSAGGGGGMFLPKMSPSRFVIENHHMLTEEEEFKIRQENWQKLPSDILIYICFYLDAHELCALSCVNYEMYIVATCDTVWRSLCYSLMKDIDEEQVDLLYKERYHLFEPGITGKVNPDEISPLSSSKSLPSLNSCTSISSIITSTTTTTTTTATATATNERSPISSTNSSKAISIGGGGTTMSNANNNNNMSSTIFNKEKSISITIGGGVDSQQHPFNTSTIFSEDGSSSSSGEDLDPTNQLQSTYSFCSASDEEREFRKRKWRFFYEIGGYVFRDSMRFVQKQFIDLAKDEERKDQLWRDVRVTSATNGSTVRELLEYVFDTIIDNGGQDLLSPTKETTTTFEFDEDMPSPTRVKSPRLLKKLINLK